MINQVEFEVYVDVYDNKFKTKESDKYCYGNIIAAKPSEQSAVDKILDQMTESYLLVANYPVNQQPRLLTKGKKAILHTLDNKFYFNSGV